MSYQYTKRFKQQHSDSSVQDIKGISDDEATQKLSLIPMHLQRDLLRGQVQTQHEKKLLQNGFSLRGFCDTSIEAVIIQSNGLSSLVQISLGNYQTLVNILKDDILMDYFGFEELGSGKFGVALLVEVHQKKYVCKSVDISHQNSISCMEQLYSQVFCSKMASILQVGPYFCKPFQYDIILHKKKAFFCLQLCDINLFNFTDENNSDQILIKIKLKERIEKDLVHNLQLMHSLKFIHGDIKPDNISWSAQFQKFIFLDFGLSRLLKQVAGQKTLTGYFGTFNFSSPEMKKIYFLSSRARIDLYKNDLYGLKISLTTFFNDLTQSATLMRDTTHYVNQNTSINLINLSLTELYKLQFFVLKKEHKIIQNILETNLLPTTATELIKLGKNDLISELWTDHLSLHSKHQQLNRRLSYFNANNQFKIQQTIAKIDQEIAFILKSINSDEVKMEYIEMICHKSTSIVLLSQKWYNFEFLEKIFLFLTQNSLFNTLDLKKSLVQKLRNLCQTGYGSKEPFIVTLFVVLRKIKDSFVLFKHIRYLKNIAGIFLLLNHKILYKETICSIIEVLSDLSCSKFMQFCLQIFMLEIFFEIGAFSLSEICNKVLGFLAHTQQEVNLKKACSQFMLKQIDRIDSFSMFFKNRSRHRLASNAQDSYLKLKNTPGLYLNHFVSKLLDEAIYNNSEAEKRQKQNLSRNFYRLLGLSQIAYLETYFKLKYSLQRYPDSLINYLDLKKHTAPILFLTKNFWSIASSKTNQQVQLISVYLDIFLQNLQCTLLEVEILISFAYKQHISALVQNSFTYLFNQIVKYFTSLQQLPLRITITVQILFSLILFLINYEKSIYLSTYLSALRQVLVEIDRMTPPENLSLLSSYEICFSLVDFYQDKKELMLERYEQILFLKQIPKLGPTLMISSVLYFFRHSTLRERFQKMLQIVWEVFIQSEILMDSYVFQLQLFQGVLNSYLRHSEFARGFQFLFKIVINMPEEDCIANMLDLTYLYTIFAGATLRFLQVVLPSVKQKLLSIPYQSIYEKKQLLRLLLYSYLKFKDFLSENQKKRLVKQLSLNLEEKMIPFERQSLIILLIKSKHHLFQTEGQKQSLSSMKREFFKGFYCYKWAKEILIKTSLMRSKMKDPILWKIEKMRVNQVKKKQIMSFVENAKKAYAQ